MPGCDGGESRKKRTDGAGCEPKRRDNGRSAAKPRTGEGSTTILCRSRAERPEAACPAHAGEDIVCAHVKAWGVRFFMKWGRAGTATRCEQKRMKQLMAGGGIALVGATLIPLLSGLFG